MGSSPGWLSMRSKWRVRCDPRRSRTGSALARPPRRLPTLRACRSTGSAGSKARFWPSESSGRPRRSGPRCAVLVRPGYGQRLGEIVLERLSDLGLSAEDQEWDSRKRQDGNWQVQLAYTIAGRMHVAEWVYDPKGRHVTPDDDEAARLCLDEAFWPQANQSAPAVVTATVTPISSRTAGPGRIRLITVVTPTGRRAAGPCCIPPVPHPLPSARRRPPAQRPRREVPHRFSTPFMLRRTRTRHRQRSGRPRLWPGLVTASASPASNVGPRPGLVVSAARRSPMARCRRLPPRQRVLRKSRILRSRRQPARPGVPAEAVPAAHRCLPGTRSCSETHGSPNSRAVRAGQPLPGVLSPVPESAIGPSPVRVVSERKARGI